MNKDAIKITYKKCKKGIMCEVTPRLALYLNIMHIQCDTCGFKQAIRIKENK